MIEIEVHENENNRVIITTKTEGPIMKKVTLSYHEKRDMRGPIRKYVQNRIGKSHPTTTYSTIPVS